MKLGYCLELGKKYLEMFKESPCRLTGESIDIPKMVLMMEYCIETNQKATKEIVERFFKEEIE